MDPLPPREAVVTIFQSRPAASWVNANHKMVIAAEVVLPSPRGRVRTRADAREGAEGAESHGSVRKRGEPAAAASRIYKR